MCIYYICTSCTQQCVTYCPEVDVYTTIRPDCTDIKVWTPTSHAHPVKCGTCTLIHSAKYKLRDLVFQHPWLSTEGMAGLEARAEWEVGQGLKKWGDESGNSDDSHDQSREDEKLVARLKRMGLGELPGKEALNEGWGVNVGAEAEKEAKKDGGDGVGENWGAQIEARVNKKQTAEAV